MNFSSDAARHFLLETGCIVLKIRSVSIGQMSNIKFHRSDASVIINTRYAERMACSMESIKVQGLSCGHFVLDSRWQAYRT